MPKKRGIETQIPKVPNFEELMNFPLAVKVEDSMGNTEKMYMDAKLQLIPATGNINAGKPLVVNKDNILKSHETFEKKKILKRPNVNDTDKENIGKRDSGHRVMFSSPLVNNATDLRKHLLVERLKQCQETPILPIQPSNTNKDDHSFSLCFASEESNSLTTDLLDPAKFTIFKMPENEIQEPSFQIIKAENRKKWMMEAKRRSRKIKKAQGVNDSFWEVFNADDSESVILKLCATQHVQTFAQIFPTKGRKQIAKLGEGSFGEVFSLIDGEDQLKVIKFIPVEGDMSYNGGVQTTFDDVISETVVAKELSDLHLGTCNNCRNFVQMKNVAVACGKFPSYFQKEWDKSNKIKSSENDNPKRFGSKQKWIIIQFEFAGCPLENFRIESWGQAYSILLQTCFALACAENYLQFEHRDLHWGNLLILKKDPTSPQDVFIVDGKSYEINHYGVQSTIIDFTFSRIKKGINLVFTDMSKDKDIFLGTGDIQFDVYRQMQAFNKNEWASFNPKTNIFWLSYLSIKLVDMTTVNEVISDEDKSKFTILINDIERSRSANEVIKNHI